MTKIRVIRAFYFRKEMPYGHISVRIAAGDYVVGESIGEDEAQDAIRRKVGRWIVDKRKQRETKMA